MVRPELVRRKLSHLVGFLDELEAYRDVDLAGYRAPGVRRAVERLLSSWSRQWTSTCTS